MVANFKKRYIGDRTFYRVLLAVALPLIIQQGITSFVSLLDNLMVGALGTEPMSSVSIVNQLINVYMLAMFGMISGASIFGAQFYGTGDWEGMRHTFRFRMLAGALLTAVAIGVFFVWGDRLSLLFLENENNTPERVAQTLGYVREYLRYAIWALIPYAVVQIYAGLLRETGETVAPMIAAVLAIFTNLSLNYVLIYGKFGFPEMGVAGAALATMIARILEMLYVVVHTHRHKERYRFIEGAYRSMHIPAGLVRRILITGSPLMFNELLWSLGMTVISGNYAVRGLDVVAAQNIVQTAWNLFSIIMMAMGSAVSILVGQKLGAGDIEGAKDADRKLIFATVALHVVIGILLFATAQYVPLLYKTEPHVQEMATQMLRVLGVSIPVYSFIHVAYFTIRSGGKTVVTFFFDCFYTWCVPVVISYVLFRYTDWPVILCYALVQFSDVIKLLIAVPLLRSGFWAKNIIQKEENARPREKENA